MMDGNQPGAPMVEAQHARPLPVLVLADVSGSMEQDKKIETLNNAVAGMIRAFAAEDTLYGEITVGVITFGGTGARLHQPFTPAPQVRWTPMSAGGRTPLGEALDIARDALEDEKAVPKRAFSPTVVLVSDGIPNDDWEPALERFLASRRGAGAVRLAVAVGPEAGGPAYQVLERFVANPAIPVVRTDEIDRVKDFFQWVTVSVSTRAHSGNPDDLSAFDSDELHDLTD
ncbi:vWA domain-containing protein [Streptomyces hygroscopicus]|uniref:vWA domain-containing protein n=1 Tax=Streptomyces hygroscopicus TaxID=1912 RepID=UPI000A62593D|nr:VWA domain-containing protein [Streptomyces hygroscopicus]